MRRDGDENGVLMSVRAVFVGHAYAYSVDIGLGRGADEFQPRCSAEALHDGRSVLSMDFTSVLQLAPSVIGQ